MTKYSELVKSILEGLTYAIDRELVEKIQKDLEKEYMLFLICTNQKEKEQLVKSGIKEIQKKLSDISPDIAPFLSDYIHPVDSNNDYNELRISIIFRFTEMEYVQDVSDVILMRDNWTSVEDAKSQEDWFWNAIVINGEYGLDTTFLNHFIENMVLANRLNRLLKYNGTNVENINTVDNELNRLLNELKQKESSNIELYKLVKEKTDLDATAL